MKRIQLLLVALFGLLAAPATQAGCPPTPNSYCVNLGLGYTAVANHLAPAQLSTFFLNPTPFTTVYTWQNNLGFAAHLYDPDLGGWDSDPLIAHGEGLIILNPNFFSINLNVVGTFQAPTLPLVLAPGFHLLGRQRVALGSFEAIVGRSPAEYTFARVYRLDPTAFLNFSGGKGAYKLFTYQAGIWSPCAPVLQVGESAFFELGSFIGGGPTFEVNGIYPKEGGDCVNNLPIVLTGIGFNGTETVTFQGSGGPVPATGINAPDPFLLEATIDLTDPNFGAATGPHTVTVVQGFNTVILPGVFNRKSCATDVNVDVLGPALIGVGNTSYYLLKVRNDGTLPASSVVVQLTGVPAGMTLAYTTPQIGIPLTSIPGGLQLTVPTLGCCGNSLTFSLTLTPSLPSLNQTYVLQAASSPAPYLDTASLAVAVVASADPNQKTGPPGVGNGRYVTGFAPFDYQIAFENKTDASAPAQNVLVTDQLDISQFDVQSLALGPMTFGSFVVQPPAGVNTYQGSHLYDVNGTPGNTADDVIVRITVTFDNVPASPTFGKVSWLFETLDQITHLPPASPLIGFLPRNVTPPEGQGTVSFNVSPHTYLASGDFVSNDARIIFDANDPIDTDPWINTFDKTVPASSVQALAPTQSNPTFPVNWSGTDADSGVASFDIYVSDNNGIFALWLTGTTATSGNYSGQADHTYRFYSIARDRVGHVESSPTSPDAFTTVTLPTPLVVNCPADINTNSCTSSVVVNFPDPAITGGALRACVPASGSSFNPGATPVVCTATNNSATNTCTFIVSVLQLAASSIDTPPANQTMCVGGAVTFTVDASGASPLSYQWRKNGDDLLNANQPTYTIANVQFSDAAAYSVLVSNICGTALSADATLAVTPASTLTLSNPRADCVHGRFHVRLNRTFALSDVRDPSHYLVRWQNGASTGVLPVTAVQSTVVGGSATDVSLGAGGNLPPEGATYRIEVSGLPGDCSLPMPTVSIAAPCDPILRGRVFRDDPSLFQNDVCDQSEELDNNSLFDEVLREYGLPGHTVIAQSTANPGVEFVATTDALGDYRISVPAGSYTVRLAPKPDWDQACPESNGTHPVNAVASGVAQLNFSRHATTSYRDMRVTVRGYAAKADHTPDTRRTPCCGQEAIFLIDYRNAGTTPVTDGIASLSLPPALVPPAPTSTLLKPKGGISSTAIAVGYDAWSWYLPTVIPGGSGQIQVRVPLNCPENSLVEVPAIAAVSDYPEDPTPGNNTATRGVFTRCSLDLSDLTVSPTGCEPGGLVPIGTEFLYTIAFHNVGTGPAFDVVVQDTLPSALDPNTIEMVNWSHDFVASLAGNTLQWSMLDVALPPDAENSADSQGFLTFKVRPVNNASLGLPIRNSANIYFDLNTPVITARTTNTLSNAALPVATFSASKSAVRPGQSIDFTYTGGTAGATFLWEFGPDANPATATTPNPSGVTFANVGRRTVHLTVTLGSCASTAAQSLLVAEPRITITLRGAPPGRARLLWPLPDFRVQTSEFPLPFQWMDLPGSSGLLVPATEPEKIYRLINP